ncbi:MAG TPA: glycosyltransferase N-terminal domain-containing protein [Chitinophagaceae bacterium]|nr:glycosyltransferase N-terminal domain-containing protein [Chitinophagaceae bacterium]
MSLLVYSVFLKIYILGIRLAALYNPKARQWLAGRRSLPEKLAGLIRPADRVIWFHCASLGEFEQGRPVMEAMRSAFPGHRILLTFFSPSGYEVRKDYEGADWVSYLPLDSPGMAGRFLDVVHPELVVFIKYEFWYYYLAESARRKIPLLLVSAVFRPGQPFFRWYGALHRRMLACYSHVFVQDESSASLLASRGLGSACTVSGDTRFDRVAAIASRAIDIPSVESFLDGAPCLVAGSTWKQDEQVLREALADPRLGQLRLILAPHQLGEDRLAGLEQTFPGAWRYSSLVAGPRQPGDLRDPSRVLIIDNMGMLASLYRYGRICYVGGGFTRDGVHNVLEAAVYGRPVLMGPRYQKYREATGLIEAGGAAAIRQPEELTARLLGLLSGPEELARMEEASRRFVESGRGACERVMQYIQEKRLLTSR